MDKRSKKRIVVLKQKRANLRTQLNTVRKFTDDPEEIPQLEKQLADVMAEIEKLESPGN